MFNPFCLLSKELLDAFARSGKKYFVRQTFSLTPGSNRAFMFTHYPDVAFAQEHLGAIEHDPYRQLYRWDDEDHRRRLIIAASQPEGYDIWAALFRKDWERGITVEVEGLVRAYIKSIGWKPARADGVAPQYFLHYGSLYLMLKFGSKQVRVKFEDIQKLAPCVTISPSPHRSN
ncbi:MAG TPA: hypothetical protein VGB56_07185 [Flavisolibacter sp.]